MEVNQDEIVDIDSTNNLAQQENQTVLTPPVQMVEEEVEIVEETNEQPVEHVVEKNVQSTVETTAEPEEVFLIVDAKRYPAEEPSDYDSKTDSYFDGKLLELWAQYFLKIFITTFTAGILGPFAKCIYSKYIYSHTVYNGKRLKFEGEPVDLFVKYFRWNFFRFITLGIYSFWIPTRYKEWELEHVHFEDEPLVKGDSYFTGSVGGYVGINLLTWLIKIVSFGLLLPVAQIVKVKWILNHCVINRKKVEFKGSAWRFLFKKLGWMLLTVITFGIYGLWVPLKTIRWEVSRTGLKKGKRISADHIVTEESSDSGKGSMAIIIAVVAVVLSILTIIGVKVWSIYGPYNRSIEYEMKDTMNALMDEYENKTVSFNNLGGGQDIKYIDSKAIADFINNGGSGKYQYVSGKENYMYLKITLVKKSTVCTFYYEGSSYRENCRSYREYKGESNEDSARAF